LYAFSAAITALLTSSFDAQAASAIFSSVAGLIVAKYFRVLTHLPFMKRSYLSFSRMWSVDSAEGAYSHTDFFAEPLLLLSEFAEERPAAGADFSLNVIMTFY
jgi:hypothetical protein